MIDSWRRAPGSYSDLRPVPALLDGQRNLAAIGDKAYISLDLDSPVDACRASMALDLIADMERLDEQLKASVARVSAAVNSSNTTLTEIRFRVSCSRPILWLTTPA